MAPKAQDSAEALAAIAQVLDRIARQIDVGLKLSIHEHQGERKTIDMVRFLGGLGCTAPDIANWLGVPYTTVGPMLSRMKNEAPKNGKRGAKKVAT